MQIIRLCIKQITNVIKHKDGFYLALLALALSSVQCSALANIKQDNVDRAGIMSYVEGLQEELEAS